MIADHQHSSLEDDCLVDDGDSTSSEEYHSPFSSSGTITIPIVSSSSNGHVTNSNNYGNPLAYSLHTIIEESGEESDADSDLRRRDFSADQSSLHLSESESLPTDSENFDNFHVAHNVINQCSSLGESDISSESSENPSEASNSDLNGNGQYLDTNNLASSRLEKYFTSGLIGSEDYHYPEDVEFQDDLNENDEKVSQPSAGQSIDVVSLPGFETEESSQTPRPTDVQLEASDIEAEKIEINDLTVRCSEQRTSEHLNDWIQKQDFTSNENVDDTIKNLHSSSKAKSASNTPAIPTIISSTTTPLYNESSFVNKGVEDIDIKAILNHSKKGPLSNGIQEADSTGTFTTSAGGRYGTVVVSGDILFAISYTNEEEALQVHIKECRNLPAVDGKRNRSDPYVKVYLLPDHTKSGKRKTVIRKHSLNPVFDEVIKFPVPFKELESRALWVTVWHKDIFGRNHFLGEVTIPFNKEVLNNPEPKWYPLQDRIISCKAGIFIALKFIPSSKGFRRGGPLGKLLILVKEAYNLVPIKSSGTTDPFCKCYLLPDRVKKQKTIVCKKTSNPKWNHTFEFDNIAIDELRERCLELTIWDRDKLTRNNFLGGIRLSLGKGKTGAEWLDSSKEEASLWRQMLERTNMWVYGELRLRSNFKFRQGLSRK